MKPTLHYASLESLRARYTELLSSPNGWAETEFKQHFDVKRYDPEAVSITIQNGRVLDSVNRPIYSMRQMCMLLEGAPAGASIYLDDMFSPGFESLPYSGRDYAIYTFCWAQSFDKYDFTRGMLNWMRPYELMVAASARKIYVASPILQDLACAALGVEDNVVEYVGLPFNSSMVRPLLDPSMMPEVDVVYSSRFDMEKNPNFFLDLVETMPHVRFAVCTGHEKLRGNDYAAVARALDLQDKGRLQIFTNLNKGEYYGVLNAAKVQLNTGYQDWVSFTLLEALTFGCLPCYPFARDFAHVFRMCPWFTYEAGVLSSAQGTVEALLSQETSAGDRKALDEILAFHDGTLGRISDSILKDKYANR